MAKAGQDRDRENRPARVQIRYALDVEGKQLVELPFVMVSMADLRFDQTRDKNIKDLRDRTTKDVKEISAENFDRTMKYYSPKAKYSVPSVLPGTDGKDIPIDLTFESLDDFSPAAVAKKVPQLRALLDTRNMLKDLKSKADGDRDLEAALDKMRNDPTLMKALMAKAPPAS